MKSEAYSGTPLAKKLGLKPGFLIRLIHVPEPYFSWLAPMPEGIVVVQDEVSKKDFIHYFAVHSEQLLADLPDLRQEIKENGMIWISWYKKASKVPTDLNEDLIRDIALSNGLVDVKVCSINEKWSGLKLVIRLRDRKNN